MLYDRLGKYHIVINFINRFINRPQEVIGSTRRLTVSTGSGTYGQDNVKNIV